MARADTLHIRLDDDLYDRIIRLAKKERRSINNMVLKILDDSPQLKAEPKLNGHAHKAPKAGATA